MSLPEDKDKIKQLLFEGYIRGALHFMGNEKYPTTKDLTEAFEAWYKANAGNYLFT